MVVALLGVVLTSGCADRSPPQSVAPRVSLDASPSGSLAPSTPEPSEDGILLPPPVLNSDDIALTCGSPVTFHPRALQGPSGVEAADHPAAAALREFISEGGPVRGTQGWYLAALSDTEALFLLPEHSGELGIWSAEFEATGGQWSYVRSGQCDLRPSFDDIGPATWTLAPGQTLTRETVVIGALVTELTCASGNSPDGRVVPAAAVYLENAVIVTFGVRPLPGAQTCEGAPPADVRLRLDEPLGDRELLDGSEYPPIWRGGPPT